MRRPGSLDDCAPRVVLFVVLDDKVEKLDILVAVKLDPESTIVNDLVELVNVLPLYKVGPGVLQLTCDPLSYQ